MADLKRIQEQILSMEGRPNNVEESEITRILRKLRDEHGIDAGWRDTGHGKSCWIGNSTFSICTHNRGSKQLKACYVKAFIKATMEAGIYDEN
jgi:hypothetical protein